MSAQNAVRNGGAGAYIEYPHRPRDTIRTPTGIFCNNYDAKIQAIRVATEKPLNSNHGPQP